MTITTTPPCPATPSYRAVLQILLDLARVTHAALDDSEELAGDHGRVHAIDGQAFEDMCEQLDRLDALPDDQPGVTLGPSGKAHWALRHVLGESTDTPAQGSECANCANGMGDCQRGAPLSDDQIIEIANEVHRAMPADADDQAEVLAIVRECFAQAAPAAVASGLPPPSDTLWRMLTGGYSHQYIIKLCDESNDGRVLLERAISNWQQICTEISATQVAHAPTTSAQLPAGLVAAINAAPADATVIEHNGHPVFLTRDGTDLAAILAADDRYRDLRATVQSIKHLAGEIVLQVVDGGEVPQDLESGEEVCVLYEALDQQEEA